MTARAVPLLTAIVALLLSSGATGQVVLRGGGTPPEGQVVGVGEEGVVIETGRTQAGPRSSTRVIIGWDRVRSVGGAFAGDAQAYMDVATDAWRARYRLERGDTVAAEPLFEKLFERYEGKAGPTAAVVAEGLLACRLHRGAQAGAVMPWLSLMMAEAGRGEGAVWFERDRASSLERVIDPATGLAPALPPIWLDSPASRAIASSSEMAEVRTSDSQEKQVAASLANLYQFAARFEAGQDGDGMPRTARGSDAVSLVSDIVKARAGDQRERTTARESLQVRIDRNRGTWVEAWCRVGLGRSLLSELEPEQRRLGVVQLLHVPARFREDQAYLAGLALAEAIVALEDLGDDVAASVLRRDLFEGYGGHPALDWEPIRRGGVGGNGGDKPRTERT